jgi:hypothetical protein
MPVEKALIEMKDAVNKAIRTSDTIITSSLDFIFTFFAA